jgi:hypothetical protein
MLLLAAQTRAPIGEYGDDAEAAAPAAAKTMPNISGGVGLTSGARKPSLGGVCWWRGSEAAPAAVEDKQMGQEWPAARLGKATMEATRKLQD